MTLTASAGGRLRALLIFNGLPSDLIEQVNDAIIAIQEEVRDEARTATTEAETLAAEARRWYRSWDAEPDFHRDAALYRAIAAALAAPGGEGIS